jgi:hypothetical protein
LQSLKQRIRKYPNDAAGNINISYPLATLFDWSVNTSQWELLFSEKHKINSRYKKIPGSLFGIIILDRVNASRYN